MKTRTLSYIEQDLWDDFGEACKRRGYNGRTEALREYMQRVVDDEFHANDKWTLELVEIDGRDAYVDVFRNGEVMARNMLWYDAYAEFPKLRMAQMVDLADKIIDEGGK